MNRASKIFLIIFLGCCLALLGYTGYFLAKNKKQVRELVELKLPNVAKNLGEVNLPGKLLGPKLAHRAEKLNPSQIIYWTNQYRQEAGLKPLEENRLLVQAAQVKVDDMFANQYFDHVSPTGKAPADLVAISGYKYKVTGENLALGDFLNEKELVDAWMASPGHRANILNGEYTEIGVAAGLGKYEDRLQTWLAVQEFGRPAPNCPLPDQTLSKQIDDQKLQYETFTQKINNLYNESQELAVRANEKIEQGNKIYKQTRDVSQAQPYWDEGEFLREQSNTKYNEAQQIESQLKNLYKDINNLASQYNAQVSSYNECIKE